MDIRTALKWCKKTGKTAYHDTGLVYVRLNYENGFYWFRNHKKADGRSVDIKANNEFKNADVESLVAELECQYWFRSEGWEPYKKLHSNWYGGKRPGAGRKSKFKEKTVPIRVPESKVDWIKEQLENVQKQEYSIRKESVEFISRYLEAGERMREVERMLINGEIKV